MSLFLVFDTETTGLVNSRRDASDPSQPHLVQLAAQLLDEDSERELATLAVIVHPGDREIPAEAAGVHGVTTELARRVGVPPVVALAAFNHLARAAPVHVAHNAEFDLLVLAAAFHRVGRPMAGLTPRCTMKLSTALLDLPPSERMRSAGMTGPKPPRLAECVRFLFDEALPGAHDALVDTRACARVYRELLRRGVAA